MILLSIHLIYQKYQCISIVMYVLNKIDLFHDESYLLSNISCNLMYNLIMYHICASFLICLPLRSYQNILMYHLTCHMERYGLHQSELRSLIR
jgi:hypothetical protein